MRKGKQRIATKVPGIPRGSFELWRHMVAQGATDGGCALLACVPGMPQSMRLWSERPAQAS